MSPLDRLAAAISRASLAFWEQRARMGRMRKPKPKKKPGRVNKYKNAAGTGCGTGAGGFKAGNNCQKEDGIPNSPQTPYIAKSFAQKSKSGKAASLPASKEALAAKEQALKGLLKASTIAAARKKAAIRKKEKEAKAASESKQRAEALAKKREEMLKTIRRKKANDRLNIVGDKSVDVQQINKNKAQKASQFLKIVDGRPDADVYSSAAKEMVDSVKRAKNSSQCKGTGVGLCSYISEDVSNRLSQQFKDRPHIEVLQHMPKGRDHASVVIVNHKDKTAIEVDISEAKYQRRTKTGKFIKVKDPKITEKDVEFRDLDYNEFARDGGQGKSIFSGRGDKSIPKKSGETDVEHAQRVYQKDLDTLHARADAIDASVDRDLKDMATQEQNLKSQISAARRSHVAIKKPTKEQKQELQRAEDEHRAKMEEIRKRKRQIEEKANDELHSLVGEFTRAHSGGIATVSSSDSDYDFSLLPGGSNAGISGIKAEAQFAWKFFSKVASPVHAEAFRENKFKVRAGDGGSHDKDEKAITVGEDASRDTVVHEYGHAIESRFAESMRRITQDYKKRLSEFLAKTPGATIEHDYVSYYEGPVSRAVGADRSASVLGYSRRYSDFGFDAKTIKKYPNDPRYEVGTEVFSTGVQDLFLSGRKFRRQFRHHFNLTTLLLAGLI